MGHVREFPWVEVLKSRRRRRTKECSFRISRESLGGDERARKCDATAEADGAGFDMVGSELGFSSLRVLTRSGDRVENHENGCGGGAKEGERLVDRLQIEDRRPAGDQYQIGGLSSFKRGAVGERCGIDVEHLDARLADPRDLVMQAARVSRQHYGEFRFAAVRPVSGRCLRIEVDDGGVVSGSGRNDGQVQGQGGLPGPPFRLTRAMVFLGDLCKKSSLQPCKPAHFQFCTDRGLRQAVHTRTL